MIFEKPDVLYFLFLLLIPILIHLFKLRKYKTTKFSNVALIEKIQLQSRKSSTIKKWLILLSRLLGLLFLIFSFAKPILPNSDEALKENEVVIYLDNSFSMQLPGSQMSLLEEAKQSLWEQLENEQRFTLFTNTETWKNTTKQDIKNDFFSIAFSPEQLTYNNLILKAESLFQNNNAQPNFFIISDGLNFKEKKILNSPVNFNLKWIQKQASSLENFSIVSAKLDNTSNSKFLDVYLESSIAATEDITVSLLEGEELIAKNKASFEGTTSAQVRFDVSNQDFSKGILKIEANGLSYDNTLYFNFNGNKTINVLSLHSKTRAYTSFLASIYQNDLFTFEEHPVANFDYSKISDVDLLILNEIEATNPVLINRLKEFKNSGGSLVIIPHESTTTATFKALVNLPGMFEVSSLSKREITSINFDHPLLTNVFSEKIQSFDYPSVSKSFKLHPSFNPILSFSNAEPFLAENNKLFSFASPLNPSASNFTNSPLVVPVLYNIGVQSSAAPLLYSTIGQNLPITFKSNLGKDEVLKLSNEDIQLIPQQRKLGNAIEIQTQLQPKTSGHFSLMHMDSTWAELSFNYDRNESKFYVDDKLQGNNSFSSVAEAFSNFAEEQKVVELWMWMLIFAIGCFILELLILRFLN